MRLSNLLSTNEAGLSHALDDFLFNPSLSRRASAEKVIIENFSIKQHIPEFPSMIEESGTVACVSITHIDVDHFKKFFEEKEKEGLTRDDIMKCYLSEHNDKLLLDIVLR